LAYVTSAQVLAMVHTKLTPTQLTDMIARADQWVDDHVVEADLNAIQLQLLSLTRCMYRVLLMDPTAWKLGEYSQDAKVQKENILHDLEEMVDLYNGVGTPNFIVGQDPVDG